MEKIFVSALSDVTGISPTTLYGLVLAHMIITQTTLFDLLEIKVEQHLQKVLLMALNL